MLHIVARGSKRGVLSPVFTLVSACEVFVFPWFPLLGFCGFCGSSGSCGSLFPPSSGSSLYANSNVFNWFSISDTSAGVAFDRLRSHLQALEVWWNHSRKHLLRCLESYLLFCYIFPEAKFYLRVDHSYAVLKRRFFIDFFLGICAV